MEGILVRCLHPIVDVSDIPREDVRNKVVTNTLDNVGLSFASFVQIVWNRENATYLF